MRSQGGSVAQLNRASDYGSEGCGFESRRNHKVRKMTSNYACHFLFFYRLCLSSKLILNLTQLLQLFH